MKHSVRQRTRVHLIHCLVAAFLTVVASSIAGVITYEVYRIGLVKEDVEISVVFVIFLVFIITTWTNMARRGNGNQTNRVKYEIDFTKEVQGGKKGMGEEGPDFCLESWPGTTGLLETQEGSKDGQ